MNSNIEKEIKRLLELIETGEMDERIREHGPHYAIGYMRGSIKFMANELERMKELSAAER